MDFPDPVPSSGLAAQIATAALGQAPTAIERFTTGLRHYVYEARFPEGRPIVVRIALRSDRDVCRAAARLSRQLRPLGVPLPELLVDGSEAPDPFLILERLAGRDLGFVAQGLAGEALDQIAAKIADAQRRVAALPTAGRYGYAATPEAAPFKRWSQLLDRGLRRTRARMASAGFYELSAADRLARVLERLRPSLDATHANPFLHDTTTKNVIVTEAGAFSGIVDVDDLCYGDPRLAPALTLASMVGGWAAPGPTAYVDRWLQHAGHRDDEVFRFYVAFWLAEFAGEEGQTFKGEVKRAAESGRAALEAALNDALAALE